MSMCSDIVSPTYSMDRLCSVPGMTRRCCRLGVPWHSSTGEEEEVFEGFEEFDVAGSGTSIHGRLGGNGPPLLLLHGFPETHVMWHRIAPALAKHFSVVVADLRGYGGSGTPPSNSDHAPYTKRVMAADMVMVMRCLGHERFFGGGSRSRRAGGLPNGARPQ